MRISIIGAGGAGRAHSRRFAAQTGVQVVCFFDPKREGAIDAVPVRNDYPAILREVDAVSICTPDGTHARYAIEALDAQKAVLIEKPMVGSIDQLRPLRTARERHPESVLAVHHQMRYVPAFAKAAALAQAGTLGKIGYVSAGYWHDMRRRGRQFDDWRITGKGQSVVFGAACHPLDLIMHLLGEQPVEVFAAGSKNLYPEYPGDYTLAQITLRFESGVVGSIHANNSARFPQYNDLVIAGERGTLVDNMLYREEEGLSLFSSDMVEAHGSRMARAVAALMRRFLLRRPELRRPPFSVYDHETACASVIENFVKACRGQERVLVPFAEGERVVRVCEAAERSLRLNRPVRLSEI